MTLSKKIILLLAGATLLGWITLLFTPSPASDTPPPAKIETFSELLAHVPAENTGQEPKNSPQSSVYELMTQDTLTAPKAPAGLAESPPCSAKDLEGMADTANDVTSRLVTAREHAIQVSTRLSTLATELTDRRQRQSLTEHELLEHKRLL